MNVILVVLDTTRARDTVPADSDLVPTLSSLAETGTEYRRAFAGAPWTLPSHAGLFTGTHTSRHTTHGDHALLNRSLTTLPELFSEAGYETRAVSNNAWVSDEFGFERGFDEFENVWSSVGGEDADPADFGDRVQRYGAGDAERTTELAVDWMASAGDGPRFLFCNYISAHFEYRPPEEFVRDALPEGYDYDRAVDVLDDPRRYVAGETTLTEDDLAALRALYRGEIAHLDDHLRRLVAGLRDADQWEDTLLVVTADHGENVGEHGFVGHQYNLHDTLLHVPLVVAGGSFDGPTDGDRLVHLADLAPTLLDEAGIDAPEAREQFQGRSFHPDATVPEREFVVGEYVTPQPPVETLEERFGDLPERLRSLDRALPLRAIRTEEYKLVRGDRGNRALYHVAEDPAETENLLDRRPDEADRLGGLLDDWLDSFEQRFEEAATDIASEPKERLRDLGYL